MGHGGPLLRLQPQSAARMMGGVQDPFAIAGQAFFHQGGASISHGVILGSIVEF